MITARYRSDYAGEFIITQSIWSGGKKQQTREWVANPIENQHISGRAVCIGTNVDQQYFDYTRLQRHRGGLLGSKKLQTYGIGQIATKMKLDFTVETQSDGLQELINHNVPTENIVYTTPKHCIQYPGMFYFVPYNPVLIKEALLIYLAAFDGHQEVFLLGYTNQATVGSTAFEHQVSTVIQNYASTKFYVVAEHQHHIPTAWLEHANAQAFDYRQFVSYCDV
jgi:hypothetical protein